MQERNVEQHRTEPHVQLSIFQGKRTATQNTLNTHSYCTAGQIHKLKNITAFVRKFVSYENDVNFNLNLMSKKSKSMK